MNLKEITDINKSHSALRGKDFIELQKQYSEQYNNIIAVWHLVKSKNTSRRDIIISAAGSLQDLVVDLFNENFPDETDIDIINMKNNLKNLYQLLDNIVMTK